MRFKELLEYKRDITATNYSGKLMPRMLDDQSFIRILQTEFPQAIDANYREIEGWFDDWISENEDKVMDFALRTIENKDPSPNNQYVQWVLMRYLDGTVKRFEDILTTVETLLRKYHELKVHRVLPAEISDIGKFKTATDFDDLWSKVGVAHSALEIRLNTAGKELLPKGNSQTVFNDDQVRVIVPQDQQAACYYGQGTKWCTASTSSTNYFNHYDESGKLYILIPKKPKHQGEKYQLHFQEKQFMNEMDSETSLPWILDARFGGSDLVNYFMKVEPSINTMIEFASEDILMDIVDVLVDYTKNKILPPIINKLEEDNHVAYYDWLEEGGYLFKDKKNNVKVKDGAPRYLDFDTESKDHIQDILYTVDANYADLMDMAEVLDEGDFNVNNVNDMLSIAISNRGWDIDGFEWIYTDVASDLSNNINVQVNYDDDKKINGFGAYAYEESDGYKYGGKDYS